MNRWTDPRGPLRKVVAKREVETHTEDGVLWHYVVTLDCGHEKTPNPTGVVNVGDSYRCYGCDKQD